MKPVHPEAALLRQTIDYARLRGWVVSHFRPARTRHGWRTALSGDPGFPDLVCVRGQRLLFIELKSPTGKVRQEQRVWLSCLVEVPGVEVYVFRPDDWPELEEVLR